LRARLEAAHGGASWLRRLLPARTPAVRGIYLHGAVGRGKTWLMDLFYASLAFQAKRRRHFHRLMHDVHTELAQLRHRPDPLQEVAGRLAGAVRVLCIDELNVSDIADAMLLGNLFAALLERGVTLVATSNLPPHELYRDGLQRERFLPAIALLERELQLVPLAGDTDYRLRQLTAAGIYLPSDQPGTAGRLAALFESLGGREAQHGGSIGINGRPIAVRAVAAVAVWFEFAALCEGPRSAEDYIEIAREYPTVLLSDVPCMEATADNAARRFIAAVDEFYDRGVKLIVSAAAAPAALYRGEALQGLYARTASRLTEMQSQEYLARAHRG
ncbi:MAG: AFG1 family ATPase, partial [Gammaproteobacteria bacterium]|nr:AFG1 family ATPase [Gammaproteobacteria bacterium]